MDSLYRAQTDFLNKKGIFFKSFQFMALNSRFVHQELNFLLEGSVL